MNAATGIVDTDVLTLCASCGRVVRLTPAQMVVIEAERIVLGDVVHLAFCRACYGVVA